MPLWDHCCRLFLSNGFINRWKKRCKVRDCGSIFLFNSVKFYFLYFEALVRYMWFYVSYTFPGNWPFDRYEMSLSPTGSTVYVYLVRYERSRMSVLMLAASCTFFCPVLVSYCCCNKLPQRLLRTTQTNILVCRIGQKSDIDLMGLPGLESKRWKRDVSVWRLQRRKLPVPLQLRQAACAPQLTAPSSMLRARRAASLRPSFHPAVYFGARPEKGLHCCHFLWSYLEVGFFFLGGGFPLHLYWSIIVKCSVYLRHLTWYFDMFTFLNNHHNQAN